MLRLSLIMGTVIIFGGIILPALFSAKSTEAVLLGLFLVISGISYLFNKFYKSL